ncbi:MAG: hypothetical protein JRJ12_17710, partial [Deltaproteobacteria bacterium]|nr:hypothetical protein [Deltaproteobacteria bacterium]
DLPTLGWLFRSESQTTRRTNLLIFLTPHIVASPDEAREIYQQKSEYMGGVDEGADLKKALERGWQPTAAPPAPPARKE